MGMQLPAPRNLYYFRAMLFPNCFLGILVQREIIANASSLARISPRTEGKDSNYFWNNKTILCFSIKKAQDYSRALEIRQ
jgi:hypothetical protein